LNGSGQLGDGTTTASTRPVAVLGALSFAALSAGNAHTCGVTTLGAITCWGFNGYGQLGDGSFLARPVPGPILGPDDFATVSAGGYHTCGVTTGGTAYCWGYNSDGELGDGTTSHRAIPLPVAGGLGFAGLASGGQHTCSVTTQGAAYCWGWNGWGQLGVGGSTGPEFCSSSAPCSKVPAAVVGGLAFRAVDAGFSHTCGVTPTGAAYCWGYNQNGQLGNGTTGSSSAPVQIVQ